MLAILTIGSLSLSGCGTFSDVMCGPIDDHIFYRGVRLDVEAVQEGGPKILMAADIPFSAAADTLLAPYLAYQELRDPPRNRPPTLTQERTKADQPKTDLSPQVRPSE
jgi:uncharacterized protein YceK